MPLHNQLTLIRKSSGRLWALFLVFALATALLLAFVGIMNSTAQGTEPVHFTNCAEGTGSTATIAVPGIAPQIHTDGVFTPAAGDEFAVFRPVNGTCSSAPSLCAGAMVWPGAGENYVLTVWGSDFEPPDPVNGILPGERMCWRVWDADADAVYTATVVYRSGFIYNSTGLFQDDGIYALLSLTPTRVTVASFHATSNPFSIWKNGLLVGGLILIVAAMFFFRRRRI